MKFNWKTIVWNPGLIGHLNFIWELWWADLTLITVLCESLLFLQGSGCEFCYLHPVIVGQKEAGPWTCWVFIRKEFCAVPASLLPLPNIFSLDRVQALRVQMQHLDSFPVESLRITRSPLEMYGYWWALIQLVFFSIAALFCFLRDLPGMLQRILTLIWKTHSFCFATIQHHCWLLSSACSQT